MYQEQDCPDNSLSFRTAGEDAPPQKRALRGRSRGDMSDGRYIPSVGFLYATSVWADPGWVASLFRRLSGGATIVALSPAPVAWGGWEHYVARCGNDQENNVVEPHCVLGSYAALLKRTSCLSRYDNARTGRI